MSRSLDDLEPVVREKAHRLIGVCATLGMELYIVHTYRTVEEQDEMYAQGRTEPGEIVTNLQGGASQHNFGRAIDVAFEDEMGKPTWDAPLDQWQLLGLIGERIGFTWGGRWERLRDYGHFELPG